MLLLCFETSAKAASVALFQDEELLGESYQHTALTHSQTLMVMAEDLLKQCRKSPEDITHVAVASGPGSFTGVRIGVAAAKGFAWGRELPCCGVSTLRAMALGLGIWDGYVCAAMDARRAQVYNAIFKAEKGILTRITPDRAISIEELRQELAQLPDTVYLVGDGARLCHEAIANTLLPPAWRQQQRAVGVGLAALERRDDPKGWDASALTPNYLRLSQAERERLEREKNTNKGDLQHG